MGYQSIFGSLFVIVVMMGSVFGSSQAYKFYVGGRDGWVLNPSENYNHWAERNRFQVNDTLFFKYKKGSNSVLVVSKEDYYSCNTTNPVQSFTDGDSTFQFDRSGPFFFISGTADNCNKGQKLIVVVMAVRPKTPPYTPISPSPIAAPPKYSPPPPSSSPQPMPPAISPSPNSDDTSSPPSKSGSMGHIAPAWLVLGATTLATILVGGFARMV